MDTETQSIRALLEQRLREYTARWKAEKGSLPRAVRKRGMELPIVHADYGNFGEWEPALPSREGSAAALAAIYGCALPQELTEYLDACRFAALALQYRGLLCELRPVYENAEGAVQPPQALPVGGVLYFVLGTAADSDGTRTHAVCMKQTGGLFLLEEGTEEPVAFAESLAAFLTESEV